MLSFELFDKNLLFGNGVYVKLNLRVKRKNSRYVEF